MASNSASAPGRGSRVSQFLDSPRAQRRLTVVSAAVLVAGIAAVLVVFVFHNVSAHTNANVQGKPPKTVPHVKPSKDALAVAREFLGTAVIRKHMHEAYNLVAAPLKAGISRKQWESGNNQVIPYPANNWKTALFHPVSSTPKKLYLAVSLSATKKSGLDAFTFYIELVKQNDGRWLVDYFEAENPYNGLPSTGLGG
jgi:hypothetical protein